MDDPTDRSTQKALDLIESLHQSYLAEGDVKYLDTAIEIVETLVPRNKHVEYTLYQLRESYHWRRPAPQHPAANESPSIGISESTDDSVQKEQLDLIESLRQTYLAEDDVQYLDTAIEIVQTLVPRNKQVEDTLSELLDRRQSRQSVPQELVENQSSMLEMFDDTLDLAQQEQLELIESLRQTYLNEADVQYLDTAIEIAEALEPRNKHVDSTLYELRDSYKSRQPAPQNLDSCENVFSGILDDELLLGRNNEAVTRFYELYHKFETTNSREDLVATISVLDQLGELDEQTAKDVDFIQQAGKSLNAVHEMIASIRCDRNAAENGNMETSSQQFEDSLSSAHDDEAKMVAHHNTFEATGCLVSLTAAIHLCDKSILFAPTQMHRMRIRSSLIYLLQLASRIGMDVPGTDNAIGCDRCALVLLPDSHVERSVLLATLGMRVYTRFKHSKVESDLKEAIALAESAVSRMSRGDLSYQEVVSSVAMMKFHKLGLSQNLGQQDLSEFLTITTDWSTAVNPDVPVLIDLMAPSIEESVVRSTVERWNKSQSVDDLTAAISCIQQDLEPGSRSGLPAGVMSSQLGTLLRERFLLAGEIADLDQARYWTDRAVETTPVGGIEYAYVLGAAGRVLLTCYEERNIESDLHQAIEITMKAKSLAKPGNRYRFSVYASVKDLVLFQHRLSGNIADLIAALSAARVMLSENSGDASAHWSVAFICSRLYMEKKDRADLERGLSHASKAVQIAPPDDPDRARYLDTLALLSIGKYHRLKFREDVNCAARCWKEALALQSGSGPERQSYLFGLADSLSTLHRHFGCESSRDEGILIAGEALECGTNNNLETAILRHTLHGFLLAAYRVTGRLSHLERSNELMELLLAAEPPDTRGRSVASADLGRGLYMHYKVTGDPDTLHRAIKSAQDGVQCAVRDEAQLAAQYTSLQGLTHERYNLYGDRKDLQATLEYAQMALGFSSPCDVSRGVILGNLASAYAAKYRAFDALEYLDEAIIYSRESVRLMGYDEQCALVGLGMILGIRYTRLRLDVDLEEATILARDAVELEIGSPETKAIAIYFLGSIMATRYDSYGVREDLDTAIDCFRKTHATAHANSVAFMRFLTALTATLKTRYMNYRELGDLEEAITFGEDALARIPRNHPDHAGILINILEAVSLRYDVTGKHQDFHYILQAGYQAWNSPLAYTAQRISAAALISNLLCSRDMWQPASEILQAAIRMLPKLSRRFMARADQEHNLIRFTPLTARAAALLLAVGEEPTSCIRILEFGRGVIMGLAIDCRSDSDLSQIRATHPILFEVFNELRQLIDKPVVRDQDLPFVENASKGIECEYEMTRNDREKAVYAMEDLLVTIRMLPGLERFQLPPNSSELMSIAREGPILIFNCTAIRTDAIIVTSSQIQSIRLPNMDYATSKNWMVELPKLVKGSRSTYRKRNDKFQELLLWLWETAVEPVFDVLGLKGGSNNLPRVWWIGTGPLAMAPFHAAGDHLNGSTRNCISRVISSYIPTIKALKHARHQELRLPTSEESHILLVAMPTTPSDPARSATDSPKHNTPLKSVVEEVEAIMKIVEGRANTKYLHLPCKEDVLKELPTSYIAHLACHGVSDRSSPSNSRLLLRKDDGTDEGVLDTLTVADISMANLENAQIAYLSACSTAQNSSEDLVDESIYIASAFQLAGFSHVLATQWVAGDMDCQQVAKEFYRGLFNCSEGGHEIVSRAFHHAVAKLRTERVNQPIKWGCFIHTGA